MKKYGYNLNATHQAIIFEIGTEAADSTETHMGATPVMVDDRFHSLANA